MSEFLRAGGWIFMAAAAAGVAVSSMRYFTLDPGVFFPQQREVYGGHSVGLLLHAGRGIVALAVGPWQFWGALRDRHRAWMVRNDALTFGAVILRGWLPVLEARGAPFREVAIARTS